MQAILALEDGRVFRGKGYGAKGECYGEVVFNTSITGYQEIFTDPSYSGQIVVLTNPEIGNYGTNDEDNEATRPWIEGLIVREFSRVSSNWRSKQVAEEYLEGFNVPVLSDIDTRALVRHLRDQGVEDQRQTWRKQNSQRSRTREQAEGVAFGKFRGDQHRHQHSAQREDGHARATGERGEKRADQRCHHGRPAADVSEPGHKHAHQPLRRAALSEKISGQREQRHHRKNRIRHLVVMVQRDG